MRVLMGLEQGHIEDQVLSRQARRSGRENASKVEEQRRSHQTIQGMLCGYGHMQLFCCDLYYVMLKLLCCVVFCYAILYAVILRKSYYVAFRYVKLYCIRLYSVCKVFYFLCAHHLALCCC